MGRGMAIRLALMGGLAVALVWRAGCAGSPGGALLAERGTAGVSSGIAPDEQEVTASQTAPWSGGSLAAVEGTLLDASGRVRRLAEFRGAPWVASAIYTRCGTVCPRVVDELRMLERAWAADTTWRIVLFSLDPAHDRPEVLRTFAAERGLATPRWTLLVPDSAALLPLADALGLIARPDQAGGIAHTAVFAYVDAGGGIRDRRVGLRLPKGGLAQAWRRLLASVNGGSGPVGR